MVQKTLSIPDRRIDFIILGAQKSASTYLQNCVRAHPQIWMPRGETAFFESPDYEQQSMQELLLSIGAPVTQRVGIKRPDYLGKPGVAERIQNDLPEVRLIVVLRNPVERAVSAWYHNIKEGFLPSISAEEGIQALLDRGGRALPGYPRSAEILEYGLYAKHLARYQNSIDSKSLLILLHEDVIKNPLNILRTTFEHLDVAPEFVPHKELSKRPQAVTYNLNRLQIMQFRSPLLNRFNNDRTRIIGRHRSLPRVVAAATLIALDRLLLEPIFGNKKTPLSSELTSRLYDYYVEDVNLLLTKHALPVQNWIRN